MTESMWKHLRADHPLPSRGARDGGGNLWGEMVGEAWEGWSNIGKVTGTADSICTGICRLHWTGTSRKPWRNGLLGGDTCGKKPQELMTEDNQANASFNRTVKKSCNLQLILLVY